MILATSIACGIIFSIIVFGTIQVRTRLIPQHQTRERLKNLETQTIEPQIHTPSRKSMFMATRDLSQFTFTQRIILPIIDSIQDLFMRLAPRTIFGKIERYIVLAGKQDEWNLNMIVFMWGMSIVGFGILGLVLVATMDLMLIQKIMFVAVITVIGGLLPLSIIRSKIQKRQEEITMQLPPFLDLLSISVQAGLSFDAALDRIVKRTKGPLIDEFKRMQRDLKLGLSKRDALHQMADRCDVEELYLFTTSVIQAERLGTSMGKTLVDQADNMRDRYQQMIKAKTLKAPVKMLFPLIIFIFPTIFIVIILPIAISVFNSFTGMGK